MNNFLVLIFKLVIYNFAVKNFNNLIEKYFSKFNNKINHKFKDNFFIDLSKITFCLLIIVIFEKINNIEISFAWFLENYVLHLLLLSLIFFIMALLHNSKLKKKCNDNKGKRRHIKVIKKQRRYKRKKRV